MKRTVRWVLLVAILSCGARTGVARNATKAPSAERPIRELITSFYQGILGRDPEPGAVDSWEMGYFNYAVSFDIDVRFIPREMARLFFLSEEYAARNRANSEFITDCYQVFLNRPPSQTELDNWLSGVWNRSQVMTVFSESEEFANRIQAMYPGLEGDPTRNFVTTMYIGLLDRLVDKGGLEYAAGLFDSAYASGGVETVRAQAKQMAREVIVSVEFLGKQPTTADYVTRFYRAFLGRFPNDSEVTYWSGTVTGGSLTYHSLISLFADSEEFTARLNAFFGGPTPSPTLTPTPAATVTPTPPQTLTPTPTPQPATPTPTRTPISTATPTPTPNLPTPTPTPTTTPTPDQEVTVNLPGNVPLVLVRIPAGSFQMGSPETERSRSSYEGPVHTVSIAYSFYMGKTELTQRQWLAVMGGWPGLSPTSSYGLGDNYPAYHISWDDCQNFVTALNQHITNTGQGPATFRLPSEAEWEYCCRAGTQTRFFFGDSLGCDDEHADCAAGTLPGNRSDYMWFVANNSPYGTKPVGTKLPNQFALYDMSGNVWEWCQDRWHDNYTGAPTDGNAWLSPTSSWRVARGGYWAFNASYCRSANRLSKSPEYRNYSFGARFVRTQ